ncbi:AraC family transcriptional regulator, regulatory protein of adaptative response / methylated-DNA-[protein]-cysteine methyltransferase [Marinobacter persicus]|uniref:methylated-DNA--[protein]-cysteine S-methyltransferase n=2 Tax=Marinobacter persicus TaxID=930118 RepID=A0A1I3WQU0_9GAMM|nr:hypothetical protein GCM10008110_16330 [Marinobacter persicus]SFK09822.1 AraC family transcriptional regulator, regulatory protein of adaptative response / methylated-DNA-[protein]-cysteine methyltransferase [Marinobacter persicus]
MPTPSNQALYYATDHCFLGPMLAVWTENGLSSLKPFDSQSELKAHLVQQLSGERITPVDSARRKDLQRVLAAIENPGTPMPTLTLDLQGTSFQQEVWQAIREIPPGQTRTYTELARQLNKPKATRAVANACGANTIAVLIPCHRVVRSDGTPGGYRWGLARKKALLERETCPVSP